MAGPFELQLRQFAEKAGARADEVVRNVALDVLQRIVSRSPVGNPDLWAMNAHNAYARETYNLFAPLLGVRRRSGKSLRKLYPNVTGKGYVGGRFRGNWRVSIGSVDATTTENVDPDGAQALASGAVVLQQKVAGTVVFVSNNLPYARRLEYGWSKQAPQGMVRRTVAEFSSIVDAAAAEVKQ
jgi:hypothetical protein